ncbi:hypothetical protein HS088_TW12G00869 [Tripterygium wilfordii]|uniref:RRP15-like protein n=1 Tax=Tripterygium wilfordii TaxID=458696 RepID=A0A7J7D028_TRIWF|nr:uncharacterized protein LOC120010395 [Tripterygium wilfordii]KAF5739660.1 hypothetical protein HS088_TW12G00869 [Tripterygium wilfordii]
MGGHDAVEVAKTVLEVADVAWTAMECCHHLHHHENHEEGVQETHCASEEQELESLRSENRRLRNLLEQNLRLLQNLSESPCLLNDCPPDLYARLVSTVDSKHFLSRLESLQKARGTGTRIEFPFKEATGDDMHTAEILVNVDQIEPSWWVWVTDEMVPSNVEEWSGIDDETYVVVSEEHVVEGVAHFMAKCIISSPKAKTMKPEELQKILAKALGGVSKLEKIVGVWHAGKMFYALSTWGLAILGSRAAVKIAAKGIHATSKVVLKAL